MKDDEQLATAIDYVARNPVRAGICAIETEWPWSSHGGSDCVYRQPIMGAAGFRTSDLSRVKRDQGQFASGA